MKPHYVAAGVAAMLQGRGLRTTRAGKRGATRKAGGPARGTRMAVKRATNRRSAWASLTPEQRSERIARMRAGRTAKPAQPAAPTAR